MKKEIRAQLKDEEKIDLMATEIVTIVVNGTVALAITLICVLGFMIATPLGFILVALFVPLMLIFWLAVLKWQAKQKMELLNKIKQRLK